MKSFSNRKKFAIVVFTSSIIGVCVGLSVGQVAENGLTFTGGVIATGDTDPPPNASAIMPPTALVKSSRARKGRTSASPVSSVDAKRRAVVYQGTTINPQFADKLGRAAIQTEIAAAFANLDPQPNDRSVHFAWVSKHPGLTQIGWTGNIVKLEPSPGGWLLEVEFVPTFSSAVTTFDRCVERWFYGNGGLQQIPHSHAHAPLAVGSIVRD